MDKAFKKIVLIFILLVLVKILLVSFIPAPSSFSDDYTYAKMAQSFYDSFTFSVHGFPSHQYPPLYPVILSFSYLFSDMRAVFFVMKFINVLVSSLVIFPVFLLSREFLSEKKSVLVAVLVSLMPSNFAFSGYIMAENLFYPLFMFAIYFIYKSFTQKSYWWDVLTGLFIGLSFLSRTLGLVLVPIAFVLFVVRFVQKRDVLLLKKLVVVAVVSFLAVLPWLVRNGLLFGFSVQGILGGYSNELSGGRVGESIFAVFPLLTWSFVYLGYLALASGVVFFIFLFLLFKYRKDDNLFLFSLILVVSVVVSVLFVANHNSSGNPLHVIYPTLFTWLTGRAMGRYIDFVLPLIMIAGFVGLQLYKKKENLFFYVGLTTLFMFFASQLIFFPLFPVNNISLTYLGLFTYVFNLFVYGVSSFSPVFSVLSLVFFMAIFLVLPWFILMFLSTLKFSLKKLFIIFVVLFFLSSVLVYAVNYYNSDVYWYKGDQMQFGLWINDHIRKHSVFLFDSDDGCKIEKLTQSCIYEGFPDGSSVSIMGFWMNHDIIVGKVSRLNGIDYVVTKKKLDLPLVYQRNEIYLYRVVR